MARSDLKTDAEREEIVFGDRIDWAEMAGGCRRFHGLEAEKGQRLIDEGYLHPQDRQNYAPPAEDMVEFALENGGVLDGYVVSPHRGDARISLEGVSVPAANCDAETIAEFSQRFRHADEFLASTEHGCSCWFD